jgi:hypothetical protein
MPGNLVSWREELGVRPISGLPVEFVDNLGRRWAAAVISHGRTSGYLNPRVHRAVVEFTCLDEPAPRRYAGLEVGRELGTLSEAELQELLVRSRVN